MEVESEREPPGRCEDIMVSSAACDKLLICKANDASDECGQDKTGEHLCNGSKPKLPAPNAACENLDLLKCYIRDKLFSDPPPYGNEFLTPDLVNGSFSCPLNNNNTINNSLTGNSNCNSDSNSNAKGNRRNVSVVNINYNECDGGDDESTGGGSAGQPDHPNLLHNHTELNGEPDGHLRGDRSPDSRDPQCRDPHFQSVPSHNPSFPQTVHMNGDISQMPGESPENSGNLVSHVYTNGALNNINIDVPSFETELGTNPTRDQDQDQDCVSGDEDEDSFNSCSGSMSSMLDDDVIDSILTGDEKSAREKMGRVAQNEEVWNHQNSAIESDLIVEFLDKSNNHAEARLAARRQARAEAREIRMRELERQQREAEENADKVFDLYATTDAMNRTNRVGSCIASPRSTSVLSTPGNNSYHSSRRSSEDSLEDSIGVRDIRHELREVEDRFRKAMIQNAQLDNEKSAASYQVELFKDKFEELEESHAQLQREHRDKCREHEQLKRLFTKMQGDLECFRLQLEERDSLIKEQGLVIVGGEYSSEDEKSEEGSRELNGLENGSIDSCNSVNNHNEKKKVKKPAKRALVSVKAAELLNTVGEGSLDVRLRKLAEERNELLDELRHVKLELEEERGRSRGYKSMNGMDGGLDFEDVQREANKLLGEYKFKWQKAEQDVSTLQANVARLESQVIRYKSAAETSEKVEDELKVEKRKLQRELREAQSRVEELETSNMHLQRRLDKLKNAKSTLLKEL